MSKLKNISEANLRAMGPARAADHSARVMGYNANPYNEQTEEREWQEFEQTFDTVCMEQERETDRIETAIEAGLEQARVGDMVEKQRAGEL